MITLGKIFTSWTSKVQKKTQNTQYTYKVHNKEKIDRKKIIVHVLAGLME